MTIDELIARAKEASENQCLSDLCRENFKQLAKTENKKDITTKKCHGMNSQKN